MHPLRIQCPILVSIWSCCLAYSFLTFTLPFTSLAQGEVPEERLLVEDRQEVEKNRVSSYNCLHLNYHLFPDSGSDLDWETGPTRSLLFSMVGKLKHGLVQP